MPLDQEQNTIVIHQEENSGGYGTHDKTFTPGVEQGVSRRTHQLLALALASDAANDNPEDSTDHTMAA